MQAGSNISQPVCNPLTTLHTQRARAVVVLKYEDPGGDGAAVTQVGSHALYLF